MKQNITVFLFGYTNKRNIHLKYYPNIKMDLEDYSHINNKPRRINIVEN